METATYSVALVERQDGFEVDGAALVHAVVADVLPGVTPAVIAARFHNGVAAMILCGCQAMRERSGLTMVALSGGVFQNMLLLGRAIDLLEADGFRVLRHRQVPPDDGGISLGQAVVASHLNRFAVPVGSS